MARNVLHNSPLDWLKAQPADLVKKYSSEASGVPGVLCIWAAYRGPTVSIYTLIKDDADEVEDRLYEAELEARTYRPQTPVTFHVYRNEKALLDQVVGAELIHTARSDA